MTNEEAKIASWDALVENYSGLLQWYVTKKVKIRADRKDCFQDALIALPRIQEKYDPSRAKFSTFLITEVRAIVTNYNRQRVFEEIDEAKSIPIDPQEPEFGFSNRLRKALKSLSPFELEIVISHYYYDETLQEIGKRYGITASMVYQRLQKALRTLRKEFGL